MIFRDNSQAKSRPLYIVDQYIKLALWLSLSHHQQYSTVHKLELFQIQLLIKKNNSILKIFFTFSEYSKETHFITLTNKYIFSNNC